MELLELLVAGDVDGFNTTRGERSRLEFFGADLPGLDLTGIDLSNANLDKADLSGTNLTEASLYKASMTGIDGTGLVLVRALAARLRLKEAFLEDADLTGAELSHGDLKEAVLARTKGEGVSLASARLTEVDATEAQWPGADLVEAQMFKAKFVDADLSRADLTEAKADEADFTRARLDACIGSKMRAGKAIFAGASLVGAKLDEADLQGADLTGADLSAADLTGANLTGAKLQGVVLKGAILANAALDGVDLAGLDLSEVDLRGVDPEAVGLSEDQIEGLSNVGAHYDPDAALKFVDPVLARSGDAVAVLWLNPDNENLESVRWALLRPGADAVTGVLPLSAENHMAALVVPTATGFDLIVVQDRTGGTGLVRFPLSKNGVIGKSKSLPLGYSPAILPMARGEGSGAWLWGLARRGPTLVIHRIEGDEVKPAWSGTVATARGFAGKHLPVLVSKGGVVMAVTSKGTGAPLRAPDGFPARIATAAVHEDRVLAVWNIDAEDEDQVGGLRASWLAKRGNPVVEVLGHNDAIVALDALPTPAGVWLAWIEIVGGGLEVRTTCLPGEGVTGLPLEVEPNGLRFVPGPLGDPEQAPVIAIVTAEGGLVVLDVDGRPYGQIGE